MGISRGRDRVLDGRIHEPWVEVGGRWEEVGREEVEDGLDVEIRHGILRQAGMNGVSRCFGVLAFAV